MAGIFTGVVTRIVQRDLSTVDPNRSAGNVVITGSNSISEMDNITTARTRRNSAVGIGEI